LIAPLYFNIQREDTEESVV